MSDLVSPKGRFLSQQDLVRKHHAHVDTGVWQDAADFALLQMVHTLPDTKDPVLSAAHYNRLMGAREALVTMKNICEEPKLSPHHPISENLGINE